MTLDETSAICGFCIGEAYLAGRIRRAGAIKVCATCGLKRRTWTIRELADGVDDVFQKMYAPAGSDGAWPEDIIAELLEVDCADVGEAIRVVLHQDEWPDIADGADAMYSSDTRYAELEVGAWEQQHTWEEFRRGVQFGQRYFDEGAKGLLDDLLSPIKELGEDEGTHVVTLDATIDTPVYRGRNAKNLDVARRFMADPQVQLYAPHPREGRSGRLGARGMPVFYGAFSRDTCIAELRPPVGSFVVTGAFRLTRPVRLLDLTALEHHVPVHSVFEPGYEEEVRRWMFLSDFQRLVTQPVHPDDEELEYVPTQAVADYICFELGYDGVIYPSAQAASTSWEETPATGQNVAILRIASAIELGGPTTLEQEIDSLMKVPLLHGQKLSPGPPVEESIAPTPVLAFVGGSAEVHEVTSIDVQTERVWSLSIP